MGSSILMLKLVLRIEVQEVRSNCSFKRNFLDYKSNYHVSGKNFIVQYLHSFYPLIRLSLFYQVKGTKHFSLHPLFLFPFFDAAGGTLQVFLFILEKKKIGMQKTGFFTFLLFKVVLLKMHDACL